MTTPIEQTFLYCPRCAVKHDQPGQIPFRCKACQFTLFFGPVAAVGGLVVDQANRLLLVRRARDPGKGKWGLPGGFVDRGEKIEDALRREVYEETRLRLKKIEFLFTFPNQYDYKGVLSPVIDVFYVCQVEDPGAIQLEASELNEFAWAIPDETYLDQMAFPSNRRAIEVWMDPSCRS